LRHTDTLHVPRAAFGRPKRASGVTVRIAPPPFKTPPPHTILASLLWVVALGILMLLYYAVEDLQNRYYVSACAALLSVLAIGVWPNIAMVGLRERLTYDKIRRNRRMRRSFLRLSFLTIPAITVAIYLSTYVKFDGIEHLPIFAQLVLARGAVGMFLEVYRVSGTGLLFASRAWVTWTESRWGRERSTGTIARV